MGFGYFFLFVAALAVVIGVMAYIAHVYERNRTENLRQVAGELGFEFFPTGDAALLASLGAFQLSATGRSHKLVNLLRGKSANVEVAVFDFSYRTQSGKNSSTHKQTVICFRATGLDLPQFTLSPEHFLHRFAAMLGFHDINFAEHPEFSRKFVLRGQDEAAIRALFTPAVLDYFVAQTGINTEGIGNTVIYYRSSKRIAPAEVPAAIDDGVKMLGNFLRAT